MHEPKTHLGVDPALVGRPVEISAGRAVVALETSSAMAADAHGLVHGGFIFGLADYAAMLAVNEPHVVLASSSSDFRRPVVVGDRLEATAITERREGRKSVVEVKVARGGETIYNGVFHCYSPEGHVLD